MRVDPNDVSTAKFHGYLLGSVAPRPIAFVSTVGKDGQVNLSPFSFFNAFSANPPILVFSPARRVRDNSTKHTLDNVLEVPEAVVNIVGFEMVEQMSLASTEYGSGVDEFVKSGLEKIDSQKVSPPRIKGALMSFECKVIEVKPLGSDGGAGNLVICQVLLAHINDAVLDANQNIDPYKADFVARMGGSWYSRITPESLFEIPKPLTTLGIGFDQLPASAVQSSVLTGNDLARLANNDIVPLAIDIKAYQSGEFMTGLAQQNIEKSKQINQLHVEVKRLLEIGQLDQALVALFSLD